MLRELEELDKVQCLACGRDCKETIFLLDREEPYCSVKCLRRYAEPATEQLKNVIEIPEEAIIKVRKG